MALEPITRQEQIIAGKDLKPITRMERFLKQYGGGSGGTQSDWNQTDETAPDFLKHKPFYAGFNSVKFDDEITLDSDGYTEFAPIDVLAGQLYSIRYGEAVYTLTSVDLGVFGYDGAVGLGNLSNYGLGGDEYPFGIFNVPNVLCSFYDYAGKASDTVSLAIVEDDKIGDTVTIADEISSMAGYVLVSNAVPTTEDLANGYRVTYLSGGVEYTKDSSEAEITDVPDTLTTIGFEHGNAIFIARSADMGLPLGVHFLDTSKDFDAPSDNMIPQSFTIYNSTIFAPKMEMKRMDKKFLPENIVLTSPSGKQFNITVDDSGVLTATEVTE